MFNYFYLLFLMNGNTADDYIFTHDIFMVSFCRCKGNHFFANYVFLIRPILFFPKVQVRYFDV